MDMFYFDGFVLIMLSRKHYNKIIYHLYFKYRLLLSHNQWKLFSCKILTYFVANNLVTM